MKVATGLRCTVWIWLLCSHEDLIEAKFPPLSESRSGSSELTKQSDKPNISCYVSEAELHSAPEDRLFCFQCLISTLQHIQTDLVLLLFLKTQSHKWLRIQNKKLNIEKPLWCQLSVFLYRKSTIAVSCNIYLL